MTPDIAGPVSNASNAVPAMPAERDETGRKPPENPTPQEDWNSRAPTVPLKVGWLRPDDISPAAVFLASDAAKAATGADYEATGGGDSAKDIRRRNSRSEAAAR